MNDLQRETTEWLNFIKSPFSTELKQSEFSSSTENPVRSAASIQYLDAVSSTKNKLKTSVSGPQSIYEGLQTAVNLARTSALFDPLDPKGKGDEAHFIQFTNNISIMPFITLVNSSSTQIKQKSKDSSKLVNSFVKGFKGLLEGDAAEITESCSQLVDAALSYAGQTERESNFSQNLLQVGEDGSVSIHLYNSEFEIKTEENKGVIKFESEYTLVQAEYSLSKESWEKVKDVFSKELSISTEDWLEKMKTPRMEGSTLKAICLLEEEPA